MSREIKFRIWQANQKKYLYPDTGYQGLLIDTSGQIHEDMGFGEFVQFDRGYTIQQYTGLKDKNGVEIYEGDILDNICDQYIYLVSFNNDNHGKIYGWNLLQMTYYSHTHGKIMQSPTSNKGEYPASQYHYGDSPSPEYHTIVGNIFENKELIK